MKILYLRKKLNMSQADLADKSGTTQQQIALIEKGHSDLRLSTMQKIASALGCDVRGLFFSPEEFQEIVGDILKKDFKDRACTLTELNMYCGSKYFISPFDPNWESIVITKGILKRSRKHENYQY